MYARYAMEYCVSVSPHTPHTIALPPVSTSASNLTQLTLFRKLSLHTVRSSHQQLTMHWLRQLAYYGYTICILH